MRLKKEVVLHCSDSEFGNGRHIDRWHRERGFSECGYHYIILNGKPNASRNYYDVLDGQIEPWRTPTMAGAHCKGHNAAIGICLIGKKSFTKSQFNALEKLLNALKIPYSAVHEHREYNKQKTCPNFSFKDTFVKYKGRIVLKSTLEVLGVPTLDDTGRNPMDIVYATRNRIS